MFQLDLRSKKSIHEQIIDGIKAAIVSGELTTDSKLPSVRDLSAQLTVNPNTIAKAFKSLEAQGWIYTVSGRGCFVSGESHVQNDTAVQKLFQDMTSAVRELLYMGISEKDIREKVEDMMRGGNVND